jgi:hypothetical protein
LAGDVEMNKEIRVFSSGSTRDTSEGKFEYYGFIHPLNDYSFSEYMHKHRKQSDGNLRDSNNWWKGFGKDVPLQSLVRHLEDLKLLHTGYFVYEEKKDGECRRIVRSKKIKNLEENCKEITLEECCNAIRFNVEAYKLEIIKEKYGKDK